MKLSVASIINAIRELRDGHPRGVKVHVRKNGALYVKSEDLLANVDWREKVEKLKKYNFVGREKGA